MATVWVVFSALVGLVAAGDANTAVVEAHVKAQANLTFREASGALKYPYQVPAGPYNSLWDWDSVFLGVATLSYGSGPYFVGSMMNFLDHTQSNGSVRGCLTPDGSTATIYHAKPIIIQGAYLAAAATGSQADFLQFKDAMAALLHYWDSERADPKTGLYTWHDQMESGADDLVTSICPSSYSPKCWTPAQADTLSSADVLVFLAREHQAYSKFLSGWGEEHLEAAKHHAAKADAIVDLLNTYMWDDARGYLAFNVSSGTIIDNRVFLMAFPVWGGLANATQASIALNQLAKPDMTSPFGVRSTSSLDSRYTNENVIDPYSNWRGPVWIVSNVVLAYGMNAMGYHSEAVDLANTVVATLANDLNVTGTWHECYSSADGSGLAAPGFLSWNTLGAELQANVAANRDPFSLA